jgi:hypothetical protein
MATQNLTDIMSTGFSGVPSGCIVLWYGSIATIPTGWVLCDGGNNTPDLRNKFIVGAYSDSTFTASTIVTGADTKQGGTKDAVVVSHTHTVTDPGHFHLWGGGGNMQAGNDNGGSSVNGGSSNHSTSTKVTGISIDAAGVAGTNQNLPPYYSLAYIMKA